MTTAHVAILLPLLTCLLTTSGCTTPASAKVELISSRIERRPDSCLSVHLSETTIVASPQFNVFLEDGPLVAQATLQEGSLHQFFENGDRKFNFTACFNHVTDPDASRRFMQLRAGEVTVKITIRYGEFHATIGKTQGRLFVRPELTDIPFAPPLDPREVATSLQLLQTNSEMSGVYSVERVEHAGSPVVHLRRYQSILGVQPLIREDASFKLLSKEANSRFGLVHGDSTCFLEHPEGSSGNKLTLIRYGCDGVALPGPVRLNPGMEPLLLVTSPLAAVGSLLVVSSPPTIYSYTDTAKPPLQSFAPYEINMLPVTATASARLQVVKMDTINVLAMAHSDGEKGVLSIYRYDASNRVQGPTELKLPVNFCAKPVDASKTEKARCVNQVTKFDAMAVASDIDQDGLPDLVLASSQGLGFLPCLSADCSSVASEIEEIVLPSVPKVGKITSLVVTDLDGISPLDIAMTTDGTATTRRAFQNK